MAEPETETQNGNFEVGGSFLKELPSSIERYSYEGECSFLQIFNLKLNARESPGNEKNNFILFHTSREMIETLLNPDDESTTLAKNCSSFDLDEELILIKIPSLEHSAATTAVDHAIMAAILPMGLFDSLNGYPNATIQGQTRGKQPDHGWGSIRPPSGYKRKPSVVLEVAWSEPDSKLNSDVRFWLEPADGNVKTCLTLRVDKRQPAIRIENWRPQNGRAHRFQMIQVTKVSNHITVTEDPLIIPFEDFFLRAPSIPTERDIEISHQALHVIAEKIWDVQGY
ncbi:uncharacterized protein N7479_004162 [Penicillium vulpinum]|uniref:Uncharacterized protein n=1 Tax=Penicillium vulpinum TaxID=29845 RepID=A0A1V6SC73_9EURO|nr:uncharacterized protein N7479_004162 [Penicillium vulpinum]KAJ5964286.1 hypothetical protein N7479_004162 [Penicillium vulpinum]OQE11597.1 hypothetical protein PENVUL_c002G06479 [Penicillium vulpinum]